MEIKEIRKLLKYNKHTGEFTWNARGVASFDTKYAGKVAGGRHVSGRGRESWAIKINGKKYYAHILAWAYVKGKWPEHEIDHKDHDTFNNRFRNLRQVTNSENKKNLPKRCDNSSGITGVFFCQSSSRWVACITVNRKKVYLGQFKEKKKAIEARMAANREYGFHRNHGK